MRRLGKRRAGLLLGLAGLLLLGQGGWIQAKALLAQHLLAQAWERTLNGGGDHRPWPWADHWPVARIHSPIRGVDWIVLEGDSGHVLAFAPGHHPRSAMPGEGGVILVSGHRDTHFRFLGKLEVGERIEVETTRGVFIYAVTETRVVDARQARVRTGSGLERLLLVTCYPFDSPIAGGTKRFVVTAVAVAG